MECPLVVHYWADLQSVHGVRCYDNIAPNAKCQRVLVLALCLVLLFAAKTGENEAKRPWRSVAGEEKTAQGIAIR